MEKLNKEKREYEEYNAKIKQLEEMTKLLVAFRYYELQQITKQDRKSELERRIQELEDMVQQMSQSLKEKKEQ